VILCGDPRAQYLAHKTEISAAISDVLEGGRYILGTEVAAFEQEFSAYVGVAHGIGVGSGTEALHLALRACGVGPGDEVVTVAHTAVATVAAIELAGCVPVLVDIEPDFYTLDPSRVEQAITARTRAIVPVHVYGQPVEMEPLLQIARTHGLRVIEDCAQAHGATCRGKQVGAWGDAGCFSFYPTKNLGAIGDGGMVVTADASLAERARLLREYGWAERYVSAVPGWNSRLDEIQAAVLRIKLRYLDRDNVARRRLAALYDTMIDQTGLVLPRQRPDTQHVYHLYAVRSSNRDELQRHLRSAGVSALVHYPVPIHLQPAYQGRLRGSDALPVTERVSREVLSLPMYPELTADQIRIVADAVRSFRSVPA
jgi:dTDP-4-amino-4,6-dideoxygalactose transaminase